MRLIARLDIKNDWVIKGIHLEGLRKVGRPVELAAKYYRAGVHEIVFMDAVASLYDRNSLYETIKDACRGVFVPISVGGGLRSLDDVSRALDAGADKVIVNTAAVRNIDLISSISRRYGSQCCIGSIEAKRQSGGGWMAYIDNGREPTGLDAVAWAGRLQQAGAGEVLVTSVDQEGTRRGFDVDLVEAVQAATTCPVIASGGYGKAEHLVALSRRARPSAVALASVLHYEQASVEDVLSIMQPGMY